MNRIVILERVTKRAYRVVFRTTTPVALQSYYADPAKTALWPDAPAADTTSLQDGSEHEASDHITIEPGATQPEIAALLEATWADFNARVQAYNPWPKYGTRWDGTSWTVEGV